MTFTTRPQGLTLRRAIHAALHSPHAGGPERFDPDFVVAYRCSRCGRIGSGPRKNLREAVSEHWRTDCPARRSKADAPQQMQILYPRQ